MYVEHFSLQDEVYSVYCYTQKTVTLDQYSICVCTEEDSGSMFFLSLHQWKIHVHCKKYPSQQVNLISYCILKSYFCKTSTKSEIISLVPTHKKSCFKEFLKRSNIILKQKLSSVFFQEKVTLSTF